MKVSFAHKMLFSLFSGLSFAVLNSVIYYLFLDQGFVWQTFIVQFLMFGFLFGFGYLFLMKKMTDRLMKKIEINLVEGEEINHVGPANWLRGVEGVGGKLLLSDQRLLFNSHLMNIQNGQIELPFDNVVEIIPRKTAGLFQNGLRIKSKSGEQFDLVVYERDTWLAKIRNQLPLQN